MTRPRMTAADYAVIAVCPTLIILMLTALVHFLVLCLYRGDYPGRLMYILFLFIFATTLIARIAIEQGRAYALGYAAALGGATFLVISRFVVLGGPAAGLSWLFNLLLLGLIWWLADRITFDCTVIDDADRASGEGLMSGGLFGGSGSLGARRNATTAADVSLDGTTDADLGETPPRRGKRAHQTADDGGLQLDSRALPRQKRGHQPGRWVLYLALAALPTFGIGQLMLPESDGVRTSAMWSLGVYLFATLTLLVTTSFLGLRRYLRQQGAEMPGDVSVAWLAGGAALVAAMLLICFALPLPGRLIASAEVPAWITSPDWLEPSRFGWGDEGAGPPQPEGTAEPPNGETQQPSPGDQQHQDQRGPSNPPRGAAEGGEQSGGEQSGGEQSGGEQSGGEQSGGEQSGGEQSGGEQSGGEQSGGEQSGGEQSGGEQSGGEQSGGEQSGGEQSGGEQSGGEQPDAAEASQSFASGLPQVSELLGTLFKLLVVAVLLGVILLFAYQNRAAILQWWENLLRWLRGERSDEVDSAADQPRQTTKVLRPFRSFRNPLVDGSDPTTAIIVSFQALEAWGRERGEPRAEGETPSEYTRRARRLFGDAAPAADRLVDAYNRVVYGRGKPTRADLSAAERSWDVMTSEAAPILSD